MTRPSTRACHQTNSFEGGFVRKFFFFLFVFFLNLIVLLIFSNVLSLSHPLFEWVYWHLEGPPNYTGEICGLFRLSFLAENYSTVLNKVGTFNVK